jgi:hypothetical protein
MEICFRPPAQQKRQARCASPTALLGRVRWTIGAAVAALAASFGGGCGNTSSEAHASASPHSTSYQKEQAGNLATVSLGETILQQLRPLESSTLSIRFEAHALCASADAKRLSHLVKARQHRLREQVIIAVRSAETWAFDEPTLQRLRRRIQLRLNRWLDEPIVEDIILTEYRFRSSP